MAARQMIHSETPGLEQIWVTNQGTDAHLLTGTISGLREGLSYRIHGTVADSPKTGTGGHVSFTIRDGDDTVRCMAYEPTKNFRHIVRQLLPGDEVIAVGSYKKGSINLEKLKVITLAVAETLRPPMCNACNKRMTSDGKGKGWKCRKCGARGDEPEIQEISRKINTGWFEVPPTARRHLAKPLCRGPPD
jgi:tRNA(Ile2)-agmatinylcytidine synthase